MPDFYDLYNANGMGMFQLMGLGGSTVGAGNLTLIVVMVAILMFRSQQIVRIGMFRRAFFMVGTSIVMTPIVQVTFWIMASSNGSGFGELGMMFVWLLNYVPAVLTGVAVIHLGSAIIPRFIPPADGTQPEPAEQPLSNKEKDKPVKHPPWLEPDDDSPGNKP